MSSVGVPAKWTPMESNQTMVEITLKPDDSEYKQVLAKFQASSQGPVSVTEVKILMSIFSKLAMKHLSLLRVYHIRN